MTRGHNQSLSLMHLGRVVKTAIFRWVLILLSTNSIALLLSLPGYLGTRAAYSAEIKFTSGAALGHAVEVLRGEGSFIYDLSGRNLSYVQRRVLEARYPPGLLDEAMLNSLRGKRFLEIPSGAGNLTMDLINHFPRPSPPTLFQRLLGGTTPIDPRDFIDARGFEIGISKEHPEVAAGTGLGEDLWKQWQTTAWDGTPVFIAGDMASRADVLRLRRATGGRFHVIYSSHGPLAYLQEPDRILTQMLNNFRALLELDGTVHLIGGDHTSAHERHLLRLVEQARGFSIEDLWVQKVAHRSELKNWYLRLRYNRP